MSGWWAVQARGHPPAPASPLALTPPLLETRRRGLRPHEGGGPDPDAVMHSVALVREHAQPTSMDADVWEPASPQSR